MELTKSNFRIFAIQAYDNPYCLSEEEFDSDLYKTSMIKKILSKYEVSTEINTKLLLNSIICFYNVFKHKEATKILAFKLSDESRLNLNTALLYLNLPQIPNTNINSKLLQAIHNEFGSRQ